MKHYTRKTKYTPKKNLLKKQRGGGFTLNQLYYLFGSQYGINATDDSGKEITDFYHRKIPLDVTDSMNVVRLDNDIVTNPNHSFRGSIDYKLTEQEEKQLEQEEQSKNEVTQTTTKTQLFNKRFQAYFDLDNSRIIIIHRGTSAVNIKDWGNNLRNLRFKDINNINANSKTTRFIIAQNGHTSVRNYLRYLFKIATSNIQSQDTSESEIESKIESKIEVKIIQYFKQLHEKESELNVDQAVNRYLNEKMSTIGHSQGAVYAYLFGGQGAEIVVYNPARFNGKKPNNTYIVRRQGDPVSWHVDDTNTNGITELNKIGWDPIKAHLIDSLKKDFKDVGIVGIVGDNRKFMSNDKMAPPKSNNTAGGKTKKSKKRKYLRNKTKHR